MRGATRQRWKTFGAALLNKPRQAQPDPDSGALKLRTIDMMSARDLQDLRDAGRGHLIDGMAPYYEKADELRKLQREEPAQVVAPQEKQQSESA